MARYLVLSDIHANFDALQAVMEDARDRYDRILCLGDIVGYGADPNEVVDWVRDHVELTVRGNHDKACTGDPVIEWFNPAAQASALWTLDTLRPENLQFLLDLPKGPLVVDTFQLSHGSPEDEDEYLIQLSEAARMEPLLHHQVNFFGHTHVQGGFSFRSGRVARLGRPAAFVDEIVLTLDEREAYLINPGSVGQPRDQDWRAAYVIFEPEAHTVAYRRVVYDVAAAQEKIIAIGAPQVLADRLAMGL